MNRDWPASLLLLLLAAVLVPLALIARRWW